MTSPLNLAIYDLSREGTLGFREESGARLEEAGPILALFGKGLCAHYLHPKSLHQAPRFLSNPHRVFPFSDGRELYLPETLDIFDTPGENRLVLRLYAAVQAGQWEWGTFQHPCVEEIDGLWGDASRLREWEPLSWIKLFLGRFPLPGLAGDIFITVETARVTASLSRAFCGLKADLRWFLPRLLESSYPHNTPRGILWDLFFALFGYREGVSPVDTLEEMVREAMRVVQPGANLKDSLQITVALYPILEKLLREARDMYKSAFQDWAHDLFLSSLANQGERPTSRHGIPPQGSSTLTIMEGMAETLDGLTFLEARLPAGSGEFLSESLKMEVTEKRNAAEKPTLKVNFPADRAHSDVFPELVECKRFIYPEWDYLRGSYRRDWVTLYQLEKLPDEGGKRDLLKGWEQLVQEVSRQFRMIRHQERRWRKRLEDGEEIDLEEALQGELERRSGIPPSEKTYMEKRRRTREVSAFLLIDLSASTSYPIEEGSHEGETVLQVLLASGAIMAQALEQLGDRYCLYGFSGYGRKQVEVLRIKSFSERLGKEHLERMGRIRSRKSTRMGAAVRHAHHILSAEPASLKLLMVLSDGFPQDCDYGDDRGDREYGLQDTAHALMEAEMDGVVPFCISVDSAGNDYLRRMCSARNYLVLKSVGDLPRQLPKIYLRLRDHW